MPATEISSAAKRQFKADAYGRMARIPSALANAHRLQLLDLLAQRPRTVQDIADEVGLSVANASQHLRVLAAAGLIEVQRKGTFAFYRAADPMLCVALSAIRTIADRTGSPPRPVRDATPEIAEVAQVRSLLDGPGTALLDVRPATEFSEGHLPGAISAPLDALRENEVSLAKSKRYLVYCRGPYCVFADEAVGILRTRGFRATRVAVGPMEWSAAGGEVLRGG